LVGSAAQNFSDLVVIAERTEQAVRMGRIHDPTKKKVLLEKEKKQKFTMSKGKVEERKPTKIITVSKPLHLPPPYPT